ncbi:hypothetical protein PDL68_23325 [Bacillus cereus]|nr:hypothetical protein [Bacillus cereus]
MNEKFNRQVNYYDFGYFSSGDYYQNVQRDTIDPGSVGCPSDGPCLTEIYKHGPNLVIKWHDVEHRDVFHFRWGRPGKPESPSELPGGYGGYFIIKNFRPNTTYTFKVSGCVSHFLAPSTCTNWTVAYYQT